MQRFRKLDPSQFDTVLQRPAQDMKELREPVQAILQGVQERGDAALLDYTARFDGVQLTNIKVTEEEIAAAANQLSPALREAIMRAKQNIETFHAKQLEEMAVVETMEGVRCWRKAVAIEKVGLYVPGGTAPLFSSVLMLAIPAQLAGCKEIVLCTPPQKEGTVHPAILYAAQLAGVNQVYRVGGAQAIAAMAYGTASVPAVYKIFGPGNAYVTVAKQLVSQDGLAIDMPAGPSEVLVIADASADPVFVAADLLSQAEHGVDSQVVLVSMDENLTDAIIAETQKQLEQLPRRDIATVSISNSIVVEVASREEALAVSNAYAPEHLIIAVDQPEAWIDGIINAGSVFLGHYTPESVGDYASGTNHTLPTNGYVRAYSGVSLEAFQKKITFQQLTKQGLQNLGPTVETMAAAEELEAHRLAVSIRLAKI